VARGGRWERKGKAGGGPASYRARPAAVGVGGGKGGGVSWRRRRPGCGAGGVFGLMGRGLVLLSGVGTRLTGQSASAERR
jgi:hypothetical protein